MKKIRWNLAITVLLLAVTTIISFCFFHFGNKYTANITVLYTLALILIALKTSGYISVSYTHLTLPTIYSV